MDDKFSKFLMIPVPFSVFQLKEMLRALSCFRLTLPKDQVLVIDECIDIIELYLKSVKID